MSEKSCLSCTAACCKGPIVMGLSAPERDMMLAAGTKLITIADPVNYDREDVIYPIAFNVKADNPDEVTGMIGEKGREFEPLAANVGRYAMMGTCGNLRKTPFGQELCGIYENRPDVCQNFQVGGTDCIEVRLQRGVDPA